jgi:flagellar motor protein MotB
MMKPMPARRLARPSAPDMAPAPGAGPARCFSIYPSPTMPSSSSLRCVLVLAGAALLLSACSSPRSSYGDNRYDPNAFDERGYSSSYNNSGNYSNSGSGSGYNSYSSGNSYGNNYSPVDRYSYGNERTTQRSSSGNSSGSANRSDCISLQTATANMRGLNADGRAAALLRPLDSERSDVLLNALSQALTGLPQARRMLLVEQDDGSVMLRVPSAVLLSSTRVIQEGFLDVIDRVAATVAQYCDVDVHVVGHTDAGGDPEYNQSLSVSRARKVRDLLAESLQRLNVRDRNLSSEGVGSSQPAFSNATDQGRSQNRRVEIFLVPPR